MDWRIKGLAQKVLSVVPFGARINDLLQRTVGSLRDFDRTVASKVADWSYLADNMVNLGVSPGGLRYLEIGTGWFPTLPLCWSLAGAASVVTFDLTRHLDLSLTMRLLELLETQLPLISRAGARNIERVEADYERLKGASSVGDLLDRARVEYRAPVDVTKSGLPAESVDVVFSNSVLEHVPPDVISEMMQESLRVLRRGGLALHSANCGDHYAYFDKSITSINYLTFTEREWRFWNNKLLFQNRLRPSDFLGLVEMAGLQIMWTRVNPRRDLLDALPTLRIAPEFRSYPREQLCSSSIDFVACKP
jgi:SAM-dependent methyltransferase